MRKWIGLFGILVVAAFLTILWSHRLQARHRQRERFEQIQVGMTKDEVVSLIGDGEEVVFRDPTPPMLFACGGFRFPWEERTRFIITLDEKAAVEEKWAAND